MPNIKLIIDKVKVHRLYSQEKLSIKSVAKILGCNRETIRQRLREFNIPVRGKADFKKRTDITKTILQHKYIAERKSMRQIATELNTSDTLISERINKFHIPARYKGEAIKGRRFTMEHRIKLSQSKIGKLKGSANNNWKGGIAENNLVIRNSTQYKTFRLAVLRMRGDKCGKCGKTLIQGCKTCGHIPDRHVHHIKPFSKFPELRFSFDNAIVLCHSCHRAQHT